MKRLIKIIGITLAVLLACAIHAQAQILVTTSTGAPVGACTTGWVSYYDLNTGVVSSCVGGAWTVTSFTVVMNGSNPTAIPQDATHRFATDAEKSTWNGKQDALTLPLAIANGGSGQVTAPLAFNAFAPSKATNALKVLRVNAGETDYELFTLAGGGDALTANPLSQFAATTSAQLLGVLSNETGSGLAVFGTSPAITTPTGIVKGDVGLGNVDNTTDAGKPVSTATATALALKADTDLGNVVGSVEVNNAAGAAAVNIQDGGNSITVDGPLTDAQLRATAVPVSAASLPLPAGAATEATLATRLAEATFTTRIPVNGQAVMAASVPVAIASNQSAVPVSGTVTANAGSGTFNIQANASVNVAQINAITPLMGTGATGTGSQRVTLATNSPGFSTANGTIAPDSALAAGRAVAYGSSPIPITSGNQAPLVSDLEGRAYVNVSHPRAVHCQFASATTTTLLELTGCAAVASNSYYITSITITGGIANAATVPALIRSGTGTNCGTGTVTLYTCWHGAAGSCIAEFTVPVKVTAAHALCMIDATVGTKAGTVTGYIAP